MMVMSMVKRSDVVEVRLRVVGEEKVVHILVIAQVVGVEVAFHQVAEVVIQVEVEVATLVIVVEVDQVVEVATQVIVGVILPHHRVDQGATPQEVEPVTLLEVAVEVRA